MDPLDPLAVSAGGSGVEQAPLELSPVLKPGFLGVLPADHRWVSGAVRGSDTNSC